MMLLQAAVMRLELAVMALKTGKTQATKIKLAIFQGFLAIY
jgi:hypothetical protein